MVHATMQPRARAGSPTGRARRPFDRRHVKDSESSQLLKAALVEDPTRYPALFTATSLTLSLLVHTIACQ